MDVKTNIYQYRLLRLVIKEWLFDTFNKSDGLKLLLGGDDEFIIGRAIVDVTYDCEYVFVGLASRDNLSSISDYVYLNLNDHDFFNNLYGTVMEHNET